MIAYAITDPSTLDFNTLARDLERFSIKATMIVYRDKESACMRAVDFVQSAKGFDFDTKRSAMRQIVEQVFKPNFK